MTSRPATGLKRLPRWVAGRLAIALAVVSLAVLPAEAELLPPGFFNMNVQPGQGAAAVEADTLNYDSINDVISAQGSVILSYQGYVIRGDRLDYHQQTGELHAAGHVSMRDPEGNEYQMDEVNVTGQMKDAFINSLTLTTAKGALITARDANYNAELTQVLTDAVYSPCGLCIDAKGRAIGWKVKAAKMVYDHDGGMVSMEQPSLELLGIPVAWLPWLSIPDPTQPRRQGFRFPSFDYDQNRGIVGSVPYFLPIGRDIDVILTPSLMSRQGALMSGDLNWRFPRFGEISLKASGIYQLDPSAFAGTVGERQWRGAIQTAGRFTPAKQWVTGWSYTVFSDNQFLTDYKFTDATSSSDKVYVTHLTSETWFDARLQQFHRLGDYDADDERQAKSVPNITAEHVQDLAPGWGRAHIWASLQGVYRGDDMAGKYHGVPYYWGYAGTKVHGETEAAWENNWVLPGGVTATPYLGLRLDGAWYDGNSALPTAPADQFLFTATPIAAMDVRWPLMATAGADTHLLEPVAQLVYRGSDTSEVGITNDDSQSLVFDTSNLFTYNHFSGIDRQDTGLRANVGLHYLGSFANGSWVDAVIGESFHVLGADAFGVTDQVNTGVNSGLDSNPSYLVASTRAGAATPLGSISGGAKVQLDSLDLRLTRAGVNLGYVSPQDVSLNVGYVYVAASPETGTPDDQQEIVGAIGIPVFDYWRWTSGITYDIADNSWLKANTGLTYDDGYLRFGGTLNMKPDSWGFGVKLALKGPDGEIAF